jgi:plastocyanin domain-containing protein
MCWKGLILGSIAASLVACDKAEATASTPACKTCVTADGRGFTPNKLTLPKAEGKTTLTFTRTSDETCARDIVIPALNISLPLPLGKPVDVAIPTEKAQTLTFQCGMGMYKSSIVVQ